MNYLKQFDKTMADVENHLLRRQAHLAEEAIRMMESSGGLTQQEIREMEDFLDWAMGEVKKLSREQYKLNDGKHRGSSEAPKNAKERASKVIRRLIEIDRKLWDLGEDSPFSVEKKLTDVITNLKMAPTRTWDVNRLLRRL